MRKRSRWRRLGLWATALAALALPAGAQILRPLGGVVGGLPAVGPTIGQTLERGAGVVDRTLPDPQSLLEDRRRRLRDLVRANRRLLDTDAAGDPIVRGEVLATSPTPQALAAARAVGFTALRQTPLEGLDLQVVVLAPPPRMSAREALGRLRKLDPQGQYDLNPLYFSAGATTAGSAAPPARTGAGASGARVGLIDTGVDTRLPVFAAVAVEQRGFAAGAPTAAAHGAATASLIAGRLGAFHGAAPGARLYVADIYGATPTGGSAEALAGALAWMAQVRVAVINVSLVGPPNGLVAAAVRALSARGARIVAAVGNDGPAAPPAYPASYPQVIAVTAVDAHDRVLPEAGRAAHVDYAAPGAQMSAAAPGGGLAAVRGTSFAAPIVAGRLALLLHEADPGADGAALAALDREARPAVGGRAGHGVIGDDVRLAPPRR